MHDLVIRGGTVVDGTGSAPREADVAVDSGRITTVGRVPQAGREEFDARDHVVTPGFVDIHRTRRRWLAARSPIGPSAGLARPRYVACLISSSLTSQSCRATSGSLEISLEATASFFTKYSPVVVATSGDDAR